MLRHWYRLTLRLRDSRGTWTTTLNCCAECNRVATQFYGDANAGAYLCDSHAAEARAQ